MELHGAIFIVQFLERFGLSKDVNPVSSTVVNSWS